MKLRIHPVHIWFVILCVACIAIGYFTARANGAEEPPAWDLIKAELSGDSPDGVPVEKLAAAMCAAMLSHPEEAFPLFNTAIIIACNSRERPKRATVFILYTACETLPDYRESFVRIARRVCPLSGAAEKVVLIPTDDSFIGGVFDFNGITPSFPGEVTPYRDGK
jgi:hypothetical protein